MDRVMLFRPPTQTASDIAKRIDRADAVTADLMADVIVQCEARRAVPESSPVAMRFRQLVAAQAWTEAALALVETELPCWSLARLAWDGGEWSCTLCRRPRMPAWLDDIVEGRHQTMPLAMLAAFIAARAADRATAAGGSVPSSPLGRDDVLCCDNFS
jgi:hypothetical protein